MRAGTMLFLTLSSLLVAMPGTVESVAPHARLEISPREATVGDRLSATLSVLLPPGVRLETGVIGPQLGPFTVEDGGWSDPIPDGRGERWTWSGSLVSFRTGEMVLPPVQIEFLRVDGSTASVESKATHVVVRSVLDPSEIAEGKAPDLADLKPPASLQPDYTGLRTAAAILTLLIALAGVAWWLQRRFAAKLARIEVPEDIFCRVPPHVWVYEALQRLLERRLVEQGEHGPFFVELSRIVKVYLGGRYRVDLIERTSGEVPSVLEQARTPAPTIEKTSELLGLADRVKFAGEQPDPLSCDLAVESVYAIVNATKPHEELVTLDERGAA